MQENAKYNWFKSDVYSLGLSLIYFILGEGLSYGARSMFGESELEEGLYSNDPQFLGPYAK